MNRTRMAFVGVSLAMCLCTSAALAAVDPAMLKARQKFFGIENVDVNTGAVKKDKVITSWATNATYVTSILGHVVLLDSYISRPELPTAPIDRRYAPFLPQDLIDLKPEAIFLGHGHGDHADNAAYIAKWTNAVIYASPETCFAMQADVMRMAADPNAINGGAPVIPNADPVTCVGTVPAGSRPGEYDETTGKSRARKLATPLDAQVCVLAFKHIHSGTAPVDPSFTHTTLFDLGDPRYPGRVITTPTPAVTYPAMYPTLTSFTPPTNLASAVPGQLNTRTTGATGPGLANGGAITIFYEFIVKSGYNFSLAWVNSSGPAKEGIGTDPGLVTLAQYTDPATPPATLALARAIGAGQYALMDTLPNVDVLNGSIVSLGATNNQERDIISVIQHLRPKVYIPGHLTDVAQKGSAIYHLIAWRETALNMGFPPSEWPEFRLLLDPIDFAVPQVYSVGDPRWFSPAKAERVAQFCN
jgi:Metallo-beta-lactamase superfamily